MFLELQVYNEIDMINHWHIKYINTDHIQEFYELGSDDDPWICFIINKENPHTIPYYLHMSIEEFLDKLKGY